MNKKLIDNLIDVFAFLSSIYLNALHENTKVFLKLLFQKEFSPELLTHYLKEFTKKHEYYELNKNLYQSKESIVEYNKQLASKLIYELNIEERFFLLIRLLFFKKFFFRFSPHNLNPELPDLDEYLILLSEELAIKKEDYTNCYHFVFNELFNISPKEHLIILTNKKTSETKFKLIQEEKLSGRLYFLKIPDLNALLFFYQGDQAMELNHKPVIPENIYFLNTGSQLTGSNNLLINYNKVQKYFYTEESPKLLIEAKNVNFTFKGSKNGIHGLNLFAESGQMIGIIGKSGAGKSTLINILTGMLKPDEGEILINKHSHQQNQLNGIIGYIPQDDLLMESLSVYENLYINASLSFAKLSKSELTEKVNHTLKSLGLYEIKNLKVGSPLNKFISGGQRKRLNIAIELIREPYILFADEPTSGLSSSEANSIFRLLLEQTFRGKIVFANVHQPPSEHYKLFDKILIIDDFGHPVYFGSPLNSVNYFSEYANRHIVSSFYCDNCGNLNHENIFDLLGAKKVNYEGKQTTERKIGVKNWHKQYLNTTNHSHQNKTEEAYMLPKSKNSIPNFWQQFFIFTKRNVLNKLSNIQYVVFALLISPLLALILATLSKSGYNVEGEYIMALNNNIPSYLFMAVIVSLFIGLIISAEEIIKDKSILLREHFLNLSKLSYLFSKLSVLVILSLIQSFLFVLIGNTILKIEGMLLSYWITLFLCACFANTLGLLISTLFNSVIVIYIFVPLLIIPQILLSGIVIEYDNLNPRFASKEYVPVIGDLMTSRWAFEGLMVKQFKDNKYEKNYFVTEQSISNLSYDNSISIPELIRAIDETENLNVDQISYSNYILNDLKERYEHKALKQLKINPSITNNKQKAISSLREFQQLIANKLNDYTQQKDQITKKLINSFGGVEHYNQFKNAHHNRKVAEWLLNRTRLEVNHKTDNKLIRKIEPIFQKPVSTNGRTHLFAASKRINETEFDTIVFNNSIVFSAILLNFALLIFVFMNKSLFLKKDNIKKQIKLRFKR